MKPRRSAEDIAYYWNVYLQSDEWATLRSTVMTPGRMCENCKTRLATDAHHKNYRNLHDVLPFDLMALCRKCHDVIHVHYNHRTEKRKKSPIIQPIPIPRKKKTKSPERKQTRQGGTYTFTVEDIRRLARVRPMEMEKIRKNAHLPTLNFGVRAWLGKSICRKQYKKLLVIMERVELSRPPRNHIQSLTTLGHA